MKKFIEPRSVALFGVSRRTGENSRNILQNMLSNGYRGKLHPINPNATEILGMKAHHRVADIDEEIDLAIINLPRSVVPGVVRECIEHGIESIIIETQGFADAIDEEGKQLQKEIDKLVKQSGVRILGPNSLGTANAFINFSSSYARLDMANVPVGVICQTGAFLFTFSETRFIGKAFDLGNACDVDCADAMEYFEQDEETKIVALHIEGVRDGKRFIESANRLARRKPVIALKTGRSAYAAEAVQSHTGSLAGRDEVWEVALRKSGVIRVNDIDELTDSVRAFSTLPLMNGTRVGIVSISGGLGVVSLDACYKYNLEPARFSPATMERIKALSPSWQGVGNPVDIWPTVMVLKRPINTILTNTIDNILNDCEVDAVLLIWNVLLRETARRIRQVLPKLAEAHPDKPIVCCLFGPYAKGAKHGLEQSGRVMVTDTPERAIRALSHLARYSAFSRGI